LLGRNRGAKEVNDTRHLREQTTNELTAAPQQLLPTPVASVTEHTTRAFEPIYSERKSS